MDLWHIFCVIPVLILRPLVINKAARPALVDVSCSLCGHGPGGYEDLLILGVAVGYCLVVEHQHAVSSEVKATLAPTLAYKSMQLREAKDWQDLECSPGATNSAWSLLLFAIFEVRKNGRCAAQQQCLMNLLGTLNKIDGLCNKFLRIAFRFGVCDRCCRCTMANASQASWSDATQQFRTASLSRFGVHVNSNKPECHQAKGFALGSKPWTSRPWTKGRNGLSHRCTLKQCDVSKELGRLPAGNLSSDPKITVNTEWTINGAPGPFHELRGVTTALPPKRTSRGSFQIKRVRRRF
ncbi:hypothetical protein B0J14DRAFT_555683 [Halenospora varia]|nr:hypothetical protein B0J14DRAFT_555683 [Halenospora varia]